MGLCTLSRAQIPLSPWSKRTCRANLWRRHADRSHSRDAAIGRPRQTRRHGVPANSACGVPLRRHEHEADAGSSAPAAPRAVFRSAPELSELPEPELLGTRAQVLAAVRLQAMLRNARRRRENEHRKLLRDALRAAAVAAPPRDLSEIIARATRCSARRGCRPPCARSAGAARVSPRPSSCSAPPPAAAPRARLAVDEARTAAAASADDLVQLLRSEEGRDAFMAACRAEHSEENLEFWLAAQAHVAIADAAARRADAAAIVDRYVRDGAAAQVNLPAKIRSALLATHGAGHTPPVLFDVAAAEVFRLMERDTYRRFKERHERRVGAEAAVAAKEATAAAAAAARAAAAAAARDAAPPAPAPIAAPADDETAADDDETAGDSDAPPASPASPPAAAAAATAAKSPLRSSIDATASAIARAARRSAAAAPAPAALSPRASALAAAVAAAAPSAAASAPASAPAPAPAAAPPVAGPSPMLPGAPSRRSSTTQRSSNGRRAAT